MRAGRIALINFLGLLVVLIAGGIIFYLWHQNYYFYGTNDAVVSGDIFPVAPQVAAVVASVDAAQGQAVRAGQAVVSLRAVPSALPGGSSGASSGATTGASSAITGTASATGVVALGALKATSPISGTVLAVTAQPGQRVAAGQPLAQVGNLSRIVFVAPRRAGIVAAVSVRPGQAVRAGQVVAALRTPPAASSETGAGASGAVAATSPINGTLIAVTAQPGQLVQPGQPVAQVVDLSRDYVTAYVDETRISDIHPGQGVDVTVDAIKDVTFHGHVGQIIPATASTFSLVPVNNYASGNYTKVAQRIPVRITLDSLQGQTLYPNASAEVTIHIHT